MGGCGGFTSPHQTTRSGGVEMGLTQRRMEDIERREELKDSILAIARCAESGEVDLDGLRVEIKRHFDRVFPEMANPDWNP